MNYKMPKNQTQYIPGSNPFGNPNPPVLRGKKPNLTREKMQKHLMQSQEKIMMLYARQLTKKDRELLQDFITKQYRVGSAIFNSLPVLLKELILKLNVEGVQVMRQYTKNPFMRFYLSFSGWSLKSLLKNLHRATPVKKSVAKTKPTHRLPKGRKEDAKTLSSKSKVKKN